MVVIRLTKVTTIAALAAYALIVAYDNIVDYGSNYEFVKHVLSMDTTFAGNVLKDRAIANEKIWQAAYASIIALEGLTGLSLHSARSCCLEDLTPRPKPSTAPRRARSSD